MIKLNVLNFYEGSIMTEKVKDPSSKDNSGNENKEYRFGGITEYKLEDIEAEVLNDNVYLDVFAGSDVRFKEEIQNFNLPLSTLANLNVYKYHYKVDEFSEVKLPHGEQIGVMAQDLEKILPQLVKEDENGLKYVNYSGLTPVLLSGIKELISVTNQQAEKIKELEEKIDSLSQKNH